MGEAKKLLNLIKKHASCIEGLSLKSNLIFDLGYDSLSLLSLIVEVEKKFSIIIEINELDECLKVESLIKLVEKKLEGVINA